MKKKEKKKYTRDSDVLLGSMASFFSGCIRPSARSFVFLFGDPCYGNARPSSKPPANRYGVRLYPAHGFFTGTCMNWDIGVVATQQGIVGYLKWRASPFLRHIYITRTVMWTNWRAAALLTSKRHVFIVEAVKLMAPIRSGNWINAAPLFFIIWDGVPGYYSRKHYK